MKTLERAVSMGHAVDYQIWREHLGGNQRKGTLCIVCTQYIQELKR